MESYTIFAGKLQEISSRSGNIPFGRSWSFRGEYGFDGPAQSMNVHSLEMGLTPEGEMFSI
jgi:hypothetical protein